MIRRGLLSARLVTALSARKSTVAASNIAKGMTAFSLRYNGTLIEYELIRSRRKTVGIIVYPDGRVVVRAPQRAAAAAVQAFVCQKAGWIVKKQQAFAALPPSLPERQYMSGESHLYLGQAYPLRVVRDSRQGVELLDGQIVLRVRAAHDAAHREKLLREWYRVQARVVFARRLEACLEQVAFLNLPTPQMSIRLMKSRWGSCSPKGRIALNLRLIQTPPTCIDYVIFHELAHLKVPNHSRAFYTLLARMLPDWRERRDALRTIAVV